MKPVIVILLAIILMQKIAIAAEPTSVACTEKDYYAAETATDYLTTWDNVYRFYKQFGNCYDGSIAEGTEGKVQLLWANSWSELPRMVELAKKDPEFKSFLWKIIESELFSQDTFIRVLSNAKERCPKDALEFCHAIQAAERK